MPTIDEMLDEIERDQPTTRRRRRPMIEHTLDAFLNDAAIMAAGAAAARRAQGVRL